MSEPIVTYQQLDKALGKLGFSVRTVPGKSRTYRHPTTGAVIPLPDVDLSAIVQPHHVVAARGVVNGFGLGDLDRCLIKAEQDRLQNELACRAFLLGARLALATQGIEATETEILTIVDQLTYDDAEEIAVEEHVASVKDVNGHTKASHSRSFNPGLNADKQLVERIVSGFQDLKPFLTVETTSVPIV